MPLEATAVTAGKNPVYPLPSGVAGTAQAGKTGTGGFFGFKRHLVVNP